ncbi:dTDP-4-dehydrorhamnose 3,5-epimerase [Erythrobacter sp. 3-20A1M]|uniref:dTDP-4-dehydrorhamnose 3,5-epimerase n=1 Tax=Erythrobacter sp. 3-20A1M TaxID=2653850 RepID=UPI00352FF0F7
MQLPVCFTHRRFGDSRGWFTESYNAKALAEQGIEDRFVQDNHSYSAARGTLRGIHLQAPPSAQAKLVRCVRGAIWDVVVDLRAESPTYGRWEGTNLDSDEGRQLYVPVGFGHAFVTLTPDCEVIYKVSDYYAPDCEIGVIWNDRELAIDWPLDGEPELSAKDRELSTLAAFDSPFSYDGQPFEKILGTGPDSQ